MNKQRIYLSPPNLVGNEYQKISDVLDSGWIAPVGKAIDEFENQLAASYENKAVVALNSGTSALHLALILSGVGKGDHVLISSFTFAACANVVLYQSANPIFIDSETQTWNLDPDLLEAYLKKAKKIPKAIIVTHLYGMPAQIDRVCSIAKEYGIIVIEDAAEALGSTFNDQYVGGFGEFGVLSFNGNKIITTSAGGALICREQDRKRAVYLATQANSGTLGYDHMEVGYNYRMSNVLAGLGVAQHEHLSDFISRKRAIHTRYQERLSEHFDFLAEPVGCFSNRWLTTATLRDSNRNIEELIQFLDGQNIETRRLWKPLHLHQAYSGYPFIGDKVAEDLFNRGICLPSGTGLPIEDQDFVIDKIKNWLS
ncbi:MAG: aminotransferase class I/II-fold pyridoxal phosphate-dependent enzyme [Ekhidna sp.]|uniref:aminotransferase class I/II-fold pyridoxal phosphate-dependent enzyme n=1 Tax=Ekhidna sp. TaxID=2608089 RepID=UPI0032EB3087